MAISIPTDYLVDVLRIDLAALGCSRVILLGSEEEMAGEGLRVGLVRWGVQVLVLHWHDHRVPIEGTGKLIHDLKAAGYGVYLLSNAGKSFERYEAQLPARDCFDGMVVSYQEHVVKPDARIYHTLTDRYGLAPGECLFIDDTPRNAFGARRLGWRAWHFTEDVPALRQALLG